MIYDIYIYLEHDIAGRNVDNEHCQPRGWRFIRARPTEYEHYLDVFVVVYYNMLF